MRKIFIARLPLKRPKDERSDDSLEVINPSNNRIYLVIDGATHLRLMEALRQRKDRYAIAEGIAQMGAGEGIPRGEARKLTRERLLSRQS